MEMSKIKRFKDFVRLQRGFDLPASSRLDGPIPIVASTGISGYHKEYKVKAPGVVTGRSGSLGTVQYISEDFWPLNTTLWVKDFQGNSAQYVYYFLQTMKLEQYNSGAGVPTLNRNDLDAVEVVIHDEAAQEKIVHVLSTYDNLIENNNRRIAILEEMAQKLYREWFVHFRFPGHEKVKMVESEMGLIPEGWKVNTIEANTILLRRGITPKYDDTALKTVINQKCVRDFSVDMGVARKQSKDYSPELNLQCGDVLINSTGAGTLGRVGQFFENTADTTVDSHVTIVRPSKNCICYIGAILKSLQPKLMDMGVGSTNQTELNKDLIKNIPVAIPTDEALDKFERSVYSWMILKNQLVSKNTNLRKTRDLLLPRLISGDIDVSELDIPIKEG